MRHLATFACLAASLWLAPAADAAVAGAPAPERAAAQVATPVRLDFSGRPHRRRHEREARRRAMMMKRHHRRHR